ncbi:MAG: hypothetical protein KC516_00310 [Nanoarchaeota archaeon]|nr:hypothetical protein [Nanoarchaeota archaeon]
MLTAEYYLKVARMENQWGEHKKGKIYTIYDMPYKKNPLMRKTLKKKNLTEKLD